MIIKWISMVTADWRETKETGNSPAAICCVIVISFIIALDIFQPIYIFEYKQKYMNITCLLIICALTGTQWALLINSLKPFPTGIFCKISLCGFHRRKSIMTWGFVNDDKFFIFGWSIPVTFPASCTITQKVTVTEVLYFLI